MSRKIPGPTIRIMRLFGLLTTALALLLVPATSAFAKPAPFGPETTDSTTATPTVLVTHTVSSSGVTTWTVLLIAVAAVAVGIALTEAVRAISRRSSRRIAVA
jgi:hypothetical protein